jgi:hypothetical protein
MPAENLVENHQHGAFQPKGRHSAPLYFQSFTNKIKMAKQMHGRHASNVTRPLYMTRISNHLFRSGIAALLFASGLALAQDQPPAPPQTPAPANGGWRRIGDPPAATPQSTTPAVQDPTEPVSQAPVDQPPAPPTDGYGQPPQQPQAAPAPQASNRPAYGIPAQLTLKPGTFLPCALTLYSLRIRANRATYSLPRWCSRW